MIPIPPPAEAKRARPEAKEITMGRPEGTREEDCDPAPMLIGGYGLPGFPGRAAFAYFRPSAEELAVLNAGGYLEMCQIGTVVQPFALNVCAADAAIPAEAAGGA